MSSFTIDILEPILKGKTLTFKIQGSDEYGLDKSIINSLRRILISEIPTLGFNVDEGTTKDICMEVNNTSLHNEFIMHRLSLLPIYMDPDNYSKQYLFYLNVKHDLNVPIHFVTSNNIEIYPLKKEVTPSKLSMDDYDMNKPLSKNEKDKIFRPFNFRGSQYPILITELKNTNSSKNIQELTFYGVPTISIGNRNARYSPVSDAIYSFTINEDIFTNIAEIKSSELNLQGDIKKKIYSIFIYIRR